MDTDRDELLRMQHALSEDEIAAVLADRRDDDDDDVAAVVEQ